ncbi:Hypothetical predicted protein [Lecanosticta acicola]|uniref:NTF2-like domain-containing protein n=1 Tax=Lecanosticta acicola TaxID=111012 RepID=A0AAI8Z8F9_9PEZI|nr:Hypothetical predicted protein [Lecanosticta acicola]
MQFGLSAVSAAALLMGTASANCLNDGAAYQVAQNFAGLFSRFTPQYTDSVLTPDFQDQSDTVNWLMSNGSGCPKQLGQLTEANRADFIRDQSTQPNMPFVIENVWHDCTNVFTRWKFDIQPQQVQGIAVLGTVYSGNPEQPYLIQHVFSEFNSGAFLVDRGDYVPTPPAGCPGGPAAGSDDSCQ